MPIESVDVVSTMMQAARYDSDQGVMTVTMKSGKSYDAPVSADQWQDFKDAPSKGSWWRTQVMGLER